MMTPTSMTAALCLACAIAQTASSNCPPIFAARDRILFQGDSIADGNRWRSLDANHTLGHGYVFAIASRYGGVYPQLELDFLNLEVSGATISRMGDRWQAETLDLRSDVLSVLIGINDILASRGRHESFDSDRAFATYDALLAKAMAARPGLKLVLCEPFVLGVGMVKDDPSGWRADVGKMDDAVAKLAEKYRAPVVHFQKTFDNALRRAPAEHWIWDGIHPTYSGHGIMADAWIEAYNDFYRSPLFDPARNSALDPQPNYERDSHDWLHRHADILDAQKKGPYDIVMIGDSITHFWGGEPKAAQANGSKVWEEAFRGLRVLNMGFGWDRTQNVLWRLAHGEFAGLKPKTIVLDMVRCTSQRRLSEITRTSDKVSPK